MNSIQEYQEKILTFMNPKVLENEKDMLINACLGMAGEGGEIVDHIKKWLYHDQELDLVKLDKEVGDAMFYVALYCNARKRTMMDIARMNVAKLTARYDGQPWTAEASKAKKDERLQNN